MESYLVRDIIAKIHSYYPSISFDYQKKPLSLIFSLASKRDTIEIWSYLLYYQKTNPEKLALVFKYPNPNNSGKYILEIFSFKVAYSPAG